MCLKDAVKRLTKVVELQEKDGMVNEIAIERSDIEELAGNFGISF